MIPMKCNNDYNGDNEEEHVCATLYNVQTDKPLLTAAKSTKQE